MNYRQAASAYSKARCSVPRCLARPIALTDLTGTRSLNLVAASEYHGVLQQTGNGQLTPRGRMTLILEEEQDARVQLHVERTRQLHAQTMTSDDFINVRWVMLSTTHDALPLRHLLTEVLGIASYRVNRMEAIQEPLGTSHRLVYEAERGSLRRLPLAGIDLS